MANPIQQALASLLQKRPNYISPLAKPSVTSPIPGKDIQNHALQTETMASQIPQTSYLDQEKQTLPQLLTPEHIKQALMALGQKIAPPTKFAFNQVENAAPQIVPKGVLAEKTGNYEQNIQIPSSQNPGQQTKVPPNIAQVLMEAFDPIKEATNAARVLHHPQEQTYTKEEIGRFGHPNVNYGENASFKPVSDALQEDRSVDRGLMRINSNTFNGLMKRHPDWLAKAGINNFSQMQDPRLNALAASLVLKDSNFDPKTNTTAKNPDWSRWFAAPYALRTR